MDIHLASDGLRGDLHVNVDHPMGPAVLRDARNGSHVGFSHDAEGQTDRRNGENIVTEISAVRSVDLVLRPATARTMWEHEADKYDYRRLVIPDGPAYPLPLCESVDGGDEPDEVEAALLATAEVLIGQLFDDRIDFATFRKKIMELRRAKDRMDPAEDPAKAIPVDDFSPAGTSIDARESRTWRERVFGRPSATSLREFSRYIIRH
jgi:hypothetical protein